MKIIHENLVAVFLKQSSVKLNKAFAIGFTILERSKEFMYDQFYNVIRPALSEADVQVVFSDTDSFGLMITSTETIDPYEKLKHIFDFSNYPKTSPKFSTEHTNQLGRFKDELQSLRMKEFVGLRSKTYAFLLEEERGRNVLKSKAKGVKKAYKKTLGFDKFKQCIETLAKTTVEQYHIRSSNHIVRTLKVQKTAFSSFDDKRFLFCSIHSAPYGSRLITENVDKCPFCT